MSKQRDVVRDSVMELCAQVDTPRSLAVALLLGAGEDLELTRLCIDPQHYTERDTKKFQDDYLVSEVLSKYKGLRTGIDTGAVALASFDAGEARCRETNNRLTSNAPEWCAWSHVIQRAQEKIARAIGPTPSWLKLQNRFRWSNGATASISGTRVRVDNKLREERISVTSEALPLLRAAMTTDYMWLRSRGLEVAGPTSPTRGEFCVVKGNVICLVDKNAKTKRTIAKEPTGNVFLQLGVGGYFRSCLMRYGVNLDDQRINQTWAQLALALDLATVDLKNASNTVCREVVWLLFPYEWARLLDQLRSPASAMPDGTYRRLEMFSSMGCGFTFELESLIFWALSSALCESQHMSTACVSVYGDDIIVPAAIVPDLQQLFEFCGFEFNKTKTHSLGLFRESCGKHYFNGVDVTPLYIKDTLPRRRKVKKDDQQRPTALPTRREHELYALHNRWLRHAVDRGWSVFSSTAVTHHGDPAVLAVAALVRAAAVAESQTRGEDTTPWYVPYPSSIPISTAWDEDLDEVIYSGLWTSCDDSGIRLRRTPYGRFWYYTGLFVRYPFVCLDGCALLAVQLRAGLIGRRDLGPPSLGRTQLPRGGQPRSHKRMVLERYVTL